MAEAWYADFNHLRRRRRPYYGGGSRFFPPLNTPFNGPFGYSSSSRVRRRPVPRPFYPNPYFGYNNAPHEDYRFETDFLDPSAVYSGSRPTKTKQPTIDSNSADYNSGNSGSVDSEITQYYDPSSATYHVGTGYKTYDGSSSSGSSSGGSSSGGYYTSGKGGSSSGSSGVGTGTGVAYDYTTDSDDGYKFTTTKVKKGTRSPTKSKNTRYKYNTYTPDNDGYKYSSDSSGYGSSGSGDHSLDDDSTDTDSYGQSKYNSYPNTHPTKNVVYQTAPKAPKSKPTTKTTTYTPPIKISDSSIDVLTKPLGSATFNLNLSPGTVYQPPSINFGPVGTNYKPLQPINQPLPIQPPATSYGRSWRSPLSDFL